MHLNKAFLPCLFFFSAALLLLNCQQGTKEQATSEESLMNYTWDELSRVTIETSDDVILEEFGRFILPIDSVTQNPIIYPVYYDNKQNHFFVHYNRNVNALDIYDMTSKKRIKRFLYPTEGPMTISRNSYAYIKSMDSIFVWTYDPPMIFLIDSTGRQINAYNFTSDRENINVNMVQHFYEIDNKIVLAYQPRYYDPMLRDSANFLIYDLASRSLIKSEAGRPLSVTNFPLYGSDAMPLLCLGYKNSVINFFGAGQLLIQSTTDNNSIKYYVLRSKYLPNSYPEPKHDGNLVSEQNFLKGSYFMMVYDPYRKYYYLMCLLDEEPYDHEGNVNGVDDKQISIIIADTLFRRRGEVLLPRNTYFRSMFVSRDGLLVSNAHPKNKNYHEDTLSYTIFKPVLK